VKVYRKLIYVLAPSSRSPRWRGVACFLTKQGAERARRELLALAKRSFLGEGSRELLQLRVVPVRGDFLLEPMPGDPRPCFRVIAGLPRLLRTKWMS
jgi:hypothetical protein